MDLEQDKKRKHDISNALVIISSMSKTALSILQNSDDAVAINKEQMNKLNNTIHPVVHHTVLDNVAIELVLA